MDTCRFLHAHRQEIQMGFTFWTLYPGIEFGSNVRLGSYIVIETGCVLGDNVLVGNCTTMRPRTTIGANCKIGHNCVFEGETFVGANTVIQSQSHITLGASIGRDVFIGPGVIGINDRRMCHRRLYMNFKPEPFSIGAGARIGAGAIILPGVHIGSNAVIGSGAIVTKDVPVGMIACGCPARVIKSVPEEELL